MVQPVASATVNFPTENDICCVLSEALHGSDTYGNKDADYLVLSKSVRLYSARALTQGPAVCLLQIFYGIHRV